MTIQFPKFISEILNTLYAAGFEAYLVGGCVRDSILGRIPGDWDITTNALPNQVMALFPHCIPTGIQHGTVTVVWEDGCLAFKFPRFFPANDEFPHLFPKKLMPEVW